MKIRKYILGFLISIPALSFSQLLCGDSLASNVSYYNINDVYLQPMPSTQYQIDLDSNSTIDLKFKYQLQGGSWGFYFRVDLFPQPSMDIVTLASNSTWVDTISKGNLISSSASWNACASGCLLKERGATYYPPPTTSSNLGIFEGSYKYFGFRLKRTSDTLYGWMLMKVDVAPNNVFIRSYAFNNWKSLGITELMSQETIEVFPNPASNKFIIRHSNSEEIKKVRLHTIEGKEIPLDQTSKEEFDLSALPDGLYFLELQTDKGILIRKIVVQR